MLLAVNLSPRARQQGTSRSALVVLRVITLSRKHPGTACGYAETNPYLGHSSNLDGTGQRVTRSMGQYRTKASKDGTWLLRTDPRIRPPAPPRRQPRARRTAGRVRSSPATRNSFARCAV